MGFEWTPGRGPCERHLATMRMQAPKPDYPMGEAWFMGEKRRMFTELEGDVEQIPVNLLQEALSEIGSGISAFGYLEEWEVWFDYLLPRIIPRCDERWVSWLLEEACTAFLQIDLDAEDSANQQTHHDRVLRTLGQSLMTPSRWQDGKIVLGTVLHPSNRNPAKVWGWANVSGDLAASMIVCLRLIQSHDIQEWVASMFAIKCPHWRAQLLTWYVGASPLLNGKIQFPSHFDSWTPKIDWSYSHVIRESRGGENIANSLISKENMTHFKAAFEANLRTADLALWKEEILEIEALRTEVGTLVRRFEIAIDDQG